ncbi:MAG: hypothetical protein KC731_25690 [Myxococcales bacterium]|nr:hypothetical protein [Myxococcales bacterium]
MAILVDQGSQSIRELVVVVVVVAGDVPGGSDRRGAFPSWAGRIESHNDEVVESLGRLVRSGDVDGDPALQDGALVTRQYLAELRAEPRVVQVLESGAGPPWVKARDPSGSREQSCGCPFERVGRREARRSRQQERLGKRRGEPRCRVAVETT